MPQVLQFAFVQRALLAVTLAAPTLGALSGLVVARRLAFFSATIGQAALTGVAVGALLGEPLDAPYASVLGVSLLLGISLVYLRRRATLPSDTLVGVQLAFTLGLGVCLLVAVTKRFNVHQLEASLFGSVLTVTAFDLLLLVIAGIAVWFVLLRYINALLLDTVSPALARAAGVPAARNEYLFVFVLTLALVVCVKVMGALMVESLVVVPAATASIWARSFKSLVWGSVVVAWVCSFAGVLVSTVVNVPSGAAIVLCLAAGFLLAMLFQPVLRRRSAAASASLPRQQ